MKRLLEKQEEVSVNSLAIFWPPYFNLWTNHIFIKFFNIRCLPPQSPQSLLRNNLKAQVSKPKQYTQRWFRYRNNRTQKRNTCYTADACSYPNHISCQSYMVTLESRTLRNNIGDMLYFKNSITSAESIYGWVSKPLLPDKLPIKITDKHQLLWICVPTGKKNTYFFITSSTLPLGASHRGLL
jgi:hypothetical protein